MNTCVYNRANATGNHSIIDSVEVNTQVCMVANEMFLTGKDNLAWPRDKCLRTL